ncbi:MAG: carbon-nitrogen hydrolase family protein [Marinobacterium sp.]|nr:carbon-nitrogen hydrolase family protein [Marinobacterium sp.]
MPAIKIAAAQCPSIAGDLERNIDIHLQMIDAAIQEGVELLVFPELSLTGYEPVFAERCKLQTNDPRLTRFRQLAIRHHITLVVGAPLDTGEKRPALGAIIFSPYGISTYHKQYLHGGEAQFFQPGVPQKPIKVKQLPVSLAICADTSHPEHALSAACAHSHIYAAGVMFSHQGYDDNSQQLKHYAQEHGMTVLMANHGAPTGGWQAAGKSTIWGPDGSILSQAPDTGAALVIAQQRACDWSGTLIPLFPELYDSACMSSIA